MSVLNPPFAVVTTGITQVLAQVFLIERVFKLSKSWYPLPFLAAPSLLGCAGAMWSAATVVLHSSAAERGMALTPVTVWLVGSVVADVLIAFTMFFYLYRAHKSAAKFDSNTMAAPLKKLMATTIESGTLSTLLAVTVLGLFLHNAASNAVAGVAYLLGRVYALTVLYLLLHPPKVGNAAVSSIVAGQSMNDSSSFMKARRASHLAPFSVAGGVVHVHRKASIAFDDGPDDINPNRLDRRKSSQTATPTESSTFAVPLNIQDRV